MSEPRHGAETAWIAPVLHPYPHRRHGKWTVTIPLGRRLKSVGCCPRKAVSPDRHRHSRTGANRSPFDQALIDLHKQGAIGDTLRFLRFPPTALIGRHQDLGKELKLDFCAQNGIRTVRRITGGGALYFDEGQLGWELVFSRATLWHRGPGGLAAAICEAAAHGLSKLGVPRAIPGPE